ncbi:MAG: phosphotransferase, partial [Gammaproteobacteria bacterium]|nr:phosphotransferase [Gammaproteobacteria bacterium]
MHGISHTPSDANPRLAALIRWLREDIGLPAFGIEPASEDASFRRYYRVRHAGQSVIAMDAPPDKENVRVYMDVAHLFRNLGLNVPEVLASDLERGFLLITDLGTELYLHALNDATVERLYGDALGALMVLQACGPADAALPCYEHGLLR